MILLVDHLAETFPMGRMQSNREKMEKIYVSLQKRIYDFLLKYTQNPETAMDLLQDSFLSFFQSYQDKDLTEEESLMLLYRIARNRSINHSKKFSTQKEIHFPSEVYYPDKRNFVKELETEDLEKCMLECLEFLDPAEKEIIILKHIEELNLSEIGKIMDISVSTASRLGKRALKNLAEIASRKGVDLSR